MWVFLALLDSQEPNVVFNFYVCVAFQPNLIFSLVQNVREQLNNVCHWKLGIFNFICVQRLRWNVLHPALGSSSLMSPEEGHWFAGANLEEDHWGWSEGWRTSPMRKVWENGDYSVWKTEGSRTTPLQPSAPEER